MDYAQAAKELGDLLRLRTFPVAFRRVSETIELDEISKVRRLNRSFSFCQAVTMVRTLGVTIGVTADKLAPICAVMFGLKEVPEGEQGDYGTRIWVAMVEDARKRHKVVPMMPTGHEAIILAPLAASKFDPEAVLIYGTPAQISLLINGLQFTDYERFQFHCSGEGACVDSLVECILSGKPALAVPCYGERYIGQVQEGELSMGLPLLYVEKAIEGLQGLHKRGIRYPIPSLGVEADPIVAEARYYKGTWLVPE